MFRITIQSYLLLILIFSTITKAQTISSVKVEHGRLKYQLRYSSKEIGLNGEGIDIQFKAQDCNKEFIAETGKRIENNLKYPFLPVLPVNGLKITQDGKSFYEDSLTKRGMFFTTLPSLFKQLVIEEQLLCKK